MITTNANFDLFHELQSNTPLFHLQFEDVGFSLVNMKTLDGHMLGQRDYIVDISGHSQTVKPEYGQSTISGINVRVINRGNEILSMIAADPYQMDRKKATVKMGYVGMNYSDLLTVATYWVSSITAEKGNTIFNFKIEDPQKWMQRSVFRSASDESPVVIQGNPLNIMLEILTSSGTEGTNGDYDFLDEDNGLNLDSTQVNISRIEDVRDHYYPGDSNYMKFNITSKIKAKEFIEKQICQPLGMYPAIDGQGKFFVIPFRPPHNKTDTQEFTERNEIIETPVWDLNLNGKINELEFYIDENDGDYTEYDYYDGTSINGRGAGVSPLKIKSDGLRTDLSPGSLSGRALSIVSKRQSAIFGRWSNPPPIKLKLKTTFWGWITEAGDIVSVTHSKVPDPITGDMGIEDRYMEVVNRSVNWNTGVVSLDLLDTGFGKDTYGVIGAAGSTIGSFKISP